MNSRCRRPDPTDLPPYPGDSTLRLDELPSPLRLEPHVGSEVHVRRKLKSTSHGVRLEKWQKSIVPFVERLGRTLTLY